MNNSAVRYHLKKNNQKNRFMRILTIILCVISVSAFAQVTPEQFKEWEVQANQGNAKAQFNLGYCYDNGEGVLKDTVEAYACYNLAGITLQVARENRDTLAKEMTTEQINTGQKRSKELQAEIEARITLNK
jgi:hypothetical protein